MVWFENTNTYNLLNNTSYTGILCLNIGDYFWGNKDTLITTILGSCVSVCIWHPEKKIGGMCHFKLPESRLEKTRKPLKYDGNFGKEAIEYLSQKISSTGIPKEEFKISIFGGSSIIQSLSDNMKFDVGNRNIECAEKELNKRGFKIHKKDVGGITSRKLYVDLETGVVAVKHNK